MRYKAFISLSMLVLMNVSLCTPLLADDASWQFNNDMEEEIEFEDIADGAESCKVSLEKTDADDGLAIRFAKYLTIYVVGGVAISAAIMGLTAYGFYTQWKSIGKK